MTAMAGAEVPEVAPPQQLDSCCACCVKHWQERVQRVLGYTIGTVERVQVTNSVFAAWEAACAETFFPRVNQKAMVTFCGQKAVRMTQLTQHLIMTCVSLTHAPA
jgi:hypothetical protein